MEYTYKNCGVDIDLANATVEDIKNILNLKADGDFAGMIEHPLLEDFCLCATTDGVGSKILPLLKTKDYDGIANDLVAMNFNDIACVGAVPLLFLDYIAINSLDKNICIEIIKALKKKLSFYSCPLVGGEIAELKRIIQPNSLDISGFALGMVQKSKILGAKNIEKGDILIGLKSNGIHTNGYSLINQLVEDNLLLLEEVMSPCQIYLKEILELNKQGLIKACANITGGGIFDNLKRIIKKGLDVEVFKENIPKTAIFDKITSIIGEDEAFKVFNMGVGMIIVAKEENFDRIKQIAKVHQPFKMGVVR